MISEFYKPIEVFESQEQLDKCLKWWQDKLLLNNWIIKARIVSQSEMEFEEDQGENSFVLERQTAIIRILRKEDMDPKYVASQTLRHCDEQILVHELLHCLYGWVGADDKKVYEMVYYEEMEHQKLDNMAKSLIMVKYDLPLDYFALEG